MARRFVEKERWIEPEMLPMMPICSDLFQVWTSIAVPVSYWRLRLWKAGLWSYRVMTLNDGSLSNGRNSFEFYWKNPNGLWIKFGDLPPPVKHSPCWRQMVHQTVLYQTNENAPRHRYFTPMVAQLQSKLKARLSSYHWMLTARTACLIRTSLVKL